MATYEQRGPSYFQDLALVALSGARAGEARERLDRHSIDIAESDEARELAQIEPDRRCKECNSVLNPQHPSRFWATPPLWMLRDLRTYLANYRPFVSTISVQPLPPGTDSINMPKSALQEKVREYEIGDGKPFINAPVRTLAGQQGIAVQLLESSPIAFDAILFRDIVADYASRTSSQVISGTGREGQVLGIRHTPGIQRTMIEGGSDELTDAIKTAINTVHDARGLPPTHVVMHPRRFEALGSKPRFTAGQTEVPVITDPAIPTTAGNRRDEDVVHVVRSPDLVLWESGPRCRALVDTETKDDGTTTPRVVLQLFAYSAFSAGRYPESVMELGGPGLKKP